MSARVPDVGKSLDTVRREAINDTCCVALDVHVAGGKTLWVGHRRMAAERQDMRSDPIGPQTAATEILNAVVLKRIQELHETLSAMVAEDERRK